MKVETYCGGPVETNGYLVSQEGIGLLMDAPDGIAHWIQKRMIQDKIQIVGLLLTHGHWDHIVDAATIQERFKVPVVIHQDSALFLENPSIQAAFNPFYEMRPCKPDRILKNETTLKLSTFELHLLLCPGHCPGSLCFYFPSAKKLFGGDVLFAGGVGRWDLPSGSQQQLMEGIFKNILTLPDETQVYPGHGPPTSVGQERRTNPYLKSR